MNNETIIGVCCDALVDAGIDIPNEAVEIYQRIVFERLQRQNEIIKRLNYFDDFTAEELDDLTRLLNQMKKTTG